jgi:DNA-binding MarR family transcriptional regulator
MADAVTKRPAAARAGGARPKSRDVPGRDRPLAKADYEALAEFRFALRKFLDFSQGAAQAAGLTPQQHQALLAIKGYSGREEVTVSELAARLLLRHHSAVELIDRLERLGLIRRRSDPADQRRVLVSVTAKAERLLGSLSATHLEEIRRLGPYLAALLERFGRKQDPPGHLRVKGAAAY